jgi:hypothetical protein
MPAWLRLAGFATVLASGALAARLVWEQTWLTWQHGPQMVGYSLAHGGGAMLLLSPLPLLVWFATVVVAIVRSWVLRRRVAGATWFDLASAGLVVGLLLVPYGVWQTLFAARLVDSPHVGDFMTHAAATGDLRTVKALVAHGARADVTDRRGATGLHVAALRNQVDVLDFLIGCDAPLDALNRAGHSPLEVAASNGASVAAELLESRGAHRIRGGEAAAEIVREASEGMDRERAR